MIGYPLRVNANGTDEWSWDGAGWLAQRLEFLSDEMSQPALLEATVCAERVGAGGQTAFRAGIDDG